MADDLRTRPAIVGGLIAGVLSVFPLTQTCCCLWALLGGAIAARMLISRSPMRVTSNEGARVGMLAGVLAGIIYFFIGLPLSLATIGWRLRVLEELSNSFNNPKLQEILQQSIDWTRNASFRTQLLSMLPQFLVVAVVIAGFTVLGALLGLAIFEKRKQEPPEPPPPPPPPPPYPGGFQPPPSYP
jgi:hypothetical protein